MTCWTERRPGPGGKNDWRGPARISTILARLLPTTTDRSNAASAVSCSRKLEGQGSFTPKASPVTQPAILVLEDGTVFEGESVGASGLSVGEVVFNTAMTTSWSP